MVFTHFCCDLCLVNAIYQAKYKPKTSKVLLDLVSIYMFSLVIVHTNKRVLLFWLHENHCEESCFKIRSFWLMLFLKNEMQTSKKKNLSKSKPTYQNSAIFEHFQKWLKNLGVVLAPGASIVHLTFTVTF